MSDQGYELPDFFDWLTARLCSDPDIGPRAWLEGTVPQGTPLPFVTFLLASSKDGLYSGGFVGNTSPLMVVKAVGAVDDLGTLNTLAAAINRQCDGVQSVTVGTLAVRSGHRTMPVYYSDTREVGGTVVNTLNVGARYQFFIHNYPQ